MVRHIRSTRSSSRTSFCSTSCHLPSWVLRRRCSRCCSWERRWLLEPTDIDACQLCPEEVLHSGNTIPIHIEPFSFICLCFICPMAFGLFSCQVVRNKYIIDTCPSKRKYASRKFTVAQRNNSEFLAFAEILAKSLYTILVV